MPSLRRMVATWSLSLVVLPLLILAGAELGLRAFFPGSELRVYLPREAGGARFMQLSNDFYRKFIAFEIPPQRQNRLLIDAIVPKPSGVFRAVVLGGSAAKGWPDSRMAYWRFLEAMAESAYPDLRFEFYCLASESMDSTVMRFMADAAARDIEPDLFLVYMGNNEFFGPYSDTFLSGFETGEARMRAVDQLHALRALRLFDVITAGRSRHFASGESLRQLDDVQQARASELILDSFAYNLNAILNSAVQGGAEVCVSTLATNLHDWPPASSAPRRPLGTAQQAAWETGMAELSRLLDAGEFEAALGEAAALRQISEGAMLSYREGQAFAILGRVEDARAALARAVDWDAFDFARPRLHTNQVIRDAATARAVPGVTLIEGDAALAQASPLGIPGREVFIDHCHLSADGAYALAAAFWPEVEAAIARRSGRAPSGTPPLPMQHCLERLGVRGSDDAAAREKVLNAYEGTLDIRGLRAFQREQYEGKPAETTSLLERQELAYLQSGPDYLNGQGYIESLLMIQDRSADALQAARLHVEVYPHSAVFRMLLGKALETSGKLEESARQFRIALDIDPDDNSILWECGAAMIRLGNCAEGLAPIERALDEEPGSFHALYWLAHGRICLERIDALEPIENLIALDPHGAERYELLAEYYRRMPGLGNEALRVHLLKLKGEYPESAPLGSLLDSLDAAE